MAFVFEELKVYQRAIAFSTNVIDAVEHMATPRKHFRLVEQLEAEEITKMLSGLINSLGTHHREP